MIHALASVSPEALLGQDVAVGPFAVIEADTKVGDRCRIQAHAAVKRYTVLGSDNLVHEGAVLGGEPQDLAWDGSQSGLRVGDRNVIREGVTLHRATRPGGETRVGSGCFLMANAHVAHECVLEDGVIMANGAVLAGHVSIGERAFLSGNVVVHQFCRIGRLAMVGGATKVIKDCLPFVITDGNPARARALNLVGLRRAGFQAAQIRVLKQAFRLLLRSALPLGEALARMRELRDPSVDELAAFCEGSRRGFHRAGREAEAG